MKTISKLILILLVVLVASCSQIDQGAQNNNLSITGTGNIVSREVTVSAFDQIEASLTFDLTIRKGEVFSVVLFSDDNFLDYLLVEQTGRNISLGFLPGYAYDVQGVTLRAEITMPELVRLSLSGSSHATLLDFKSARNLEVELSGSSSLDGHLEAEKSHFDLSSNSYLKLSGSTQHLSIDSCGNSITDLSEFRAVQAIVQASCAGTAVVNVDERLQVDASQNSQVFYISQPAVSVIQAYEGAQVDQK